MKEAQISRRPQCAKRSTAAKKKKVGKEGAGRFVFGFVSVLIFVILFVFVFGRFAFHKETTSRSGQRTSNSSKRIEDMNFAIENTMLLNGGEDKQILEV